MNKSTHNPGILSLLVCVLLSCTNPNDETLEDLTLLSGIWHGTQNLYQVGSCNLDGEDQATYQEVLRIVVNDSGYIEVLDSASSGLVFLGEVDENLKVSLKTWYTVNCPDETTHSDSAVHQGRFEIHSGYYELNTSATELWCPPDCAFDVIYHLRKEL